jgi:prepilin-type processing-associated H-X9-DG protein
VATKQFRQVLFVDWHVTSPQSFYPAVIVIHTNDVMSDFGETCRRD